MTATVGITENGYSFIFIDIDVMEVLEDAKRLYSAGWKGQGPTYWLSGLRHHLLHLPTLPYTESMAVSITHPESALCRCIGRAFPSIEELLKNNHVDPAIAPYYVSACLREILKERVLYYHGETIFEIFSSTVTDLSLFWSRTGNPGIFKFNITGVPRVKPREKIELSRRMKFLSLRKPRN